MCFSLTRLPISFRKSCNQVISPQSVVTLVNSSEKHKQCNMLSIISWFPWSSALQMCTENTPARNATEPQNNRTKAPAIPLCKIKKGRQWLIFAAVCWTKLFPESSPLDTSANLEGLTLTGRWYAGHHI